MDTETRVHIAALRSDDKQRRYEAFLSLLQATDTPVDWAYEVWDDLTAMLGDGDNHQRAIAAQLLANLARSDPDRRILRDLDALLAVTRDKRFVTARHTLQALWKIGLAGPEHRQRVVAALAARFADCATEKNGTLIRYDIAVALKKLYDAAPDESVRSAALALIAGETDGKYRAKYAEVWRRTPAS